MHRNVFSRRQALAWAAGSALGGLAGPALAIASPLVNVSDTHATAFYKEFDQLFAREWERLSGTRPVVKCLHGDSAQQVRNLIGGTPADVVSLSPAHEIDALARANLLPAYWAGRLPNNSAPTTTVPLLLVRKGNPKRILGWADVARPGVSVLIANPKTTDNGRCAYLAAWGAALRGGATAEAAQAQVGRMLANVPPALAGATPPAVETAFTQNQIGDALVLMEFEALAVQKAFPDAFQSVYPDWTLLVEHTVAWLDKVVERKNTRKQAEAYLRLLWSDDAQALAVKHGLRPRMPRLLAANSRVFRSVKTFTVDDLFSGWSAALKAHFEAGGSYDQLTAKR